MLRYPIYVIPFIFIILVILSWWVCFSLNTMVFFHRQLCWLLFFGLFFGFPHCPWVWPLTIIAAYIQTTLLSDHIVAIYSPLGSLLLDLSSTVTMMPLMATDLAVTPHLCPLFLLLAAHPSKFVLDHYMTVTRWYRHSSWIIIQRCRADSARIWEHLAGFGKVSKVVSC